jgi:hypothetical protein
MMERGNKILSSCKVAFKRAFAERERKNGSRATGWSPYNVPASR